jgi:hypothetical protein
MRQARHNWRWLFMHWMAWALSLPLPSAGSSRAAKMAMMAMTTSNSISVNPRSLRPQLSDPARPIRLAGHMVEEL